MGFHLVILIRQLVHRHHHNQLELQCIACLQSYKLLGALQSLVQYQHSTADHQNLLHMLQTYHLMFLEKLNFHQLKELLHSMVFYIALAKLLLLFWVPCKQITDRSCIHHSQLIRVFWKVTHFNLIA